MIATPMDMRALSHELSNNVWTAAAIGALFEAGLVPKLREPRSLDELAGASPALSGSKLGRCLDVAVAAGVVVVAEGRYRLADGVQPFSGPPMNATLQGELRTHLMQALAFLDAARDGTPLVGWRHTDPAILQSQGDASATFAFMFKSMMVANLGDLAARLERPGARFLDVGVGVGSLAIGMARAWPALHVVGLDVADAPLAIARQQVARAGLEARIELRRTPVEELSDVDAFELAWFPSFFVPEAAVPASVARLHTSLVPGGWILLPIPGAGADPRGTAVFGLVNELWGGPVLDAARAEALVADAGFVSIRTLAGPPWAPRTIVAQRAG